MIKIQCLCESMFEDVTRALTENKNFLLKNGSSRCLDCSKTHWLPRERKKYRSMEEEFYERFEKIELILLAR